MGVSQALEVRSMYIMHVCVCECRAWVIICLVTSLAGGLTEDTEEITSHLHSNVTGIQHIYPNRYTQSTAQHMHHTHFLKPKHQLNAWIYSQDISVCRRVPRDKCPPLILPVGTSLVNLCYLVLCVLGVPLRNS